MRLLGDTGCEIVVAERSHEGMGASLACGIAAACARYPAARGWVVGLADMPFVKQSTLTHIATALSDGAAIVAPTYEGRRGHPVGFTAHYGARLAALGGDEGARHLIACEPAALRLLPVDDPGIHADIDTPDDLIAWQTRHPLPESAAV